MRIKELNIVSFGGLQDTKLILSDGLQIICGDNESGKSTVLGFIKFMLYGLTRRKTADPNEYGRAVNWKTHTAEGSMVVETEQGELRLYRRYAPTGARSAEQTCQVTDCRTGETVRQEGEPGEWLLGVPKEVFESTAAVGQMMGTALDRAKIASALGNLMTAGDETVDLVRIRKKMDRVRTEYMHKNKKGGRIPTLAVQMAEKRGALEQATNTALQINRVGERIASSQRQRETLSERVTQLRERREQYHRAWILRRFEELHKKEEEVRSQHAILAAEEEANGRAPQWEQVEALRAAERVWQDAEEDRKKAAAEVAEAETKTVDESLASLGRMIEKKGGAGNIMNRILAPRELAKTKLLQGAILFGIGLAVLIIVNLVGMFIQLFQIEWIPFVLLPSHTLFWLGAFHCWWKAAKAHHEYKEKLSFFGQKISDLLAYLQRCEEEAARERQWKDDRENAVIQLGFAEAACKRSEDALRTLLGLEMVETVVTAEELSDLFWERIGQLEAKVRQREAAATRLAVLERQAEEERQALSEYDEEALKASFPRGAEEITSETLEELNRKCRFEEEKLRTVEDHVHTAERERLLLMSSAKDPFSLRDELAELTEQYENDRAYYEALELAIASLEKAEQSVQGSVTPALTERAGGWMARVSSGRYDSVRVTSDLRISLMQLQDGYLVGEEWLSGGTKELAYLALRLALSEQIYRTERAPMLLDEALCQIDDTRLAPCLSLLDAYARDGGQILLFTCHRREEICCEELGLAAGVCRLG